ncbi:hypothetical protein V6N13_113056 [Hibiscus sabdariffa]
MRLLQGLVPGCSKVKGKEAMLDEIINYVQSFQRLVEVVKERVAARIAENEYLKEENDRLNTDITMLEEAKEQIGLLPFSGEQFEHQRHIDHHVSISEAVDKITIELILKLLSRYDILFYFFIFDLKYLILQLEFIYGLQSD